MLESPAFAQAAGAAPDTTTTMFLQFAPLVFIFVIFYFLLIRPQRKQMKEHQAKIAAARKNDMVVTSGGLIGKVTKVDDHEVEVEIAPNVRVKVVKSMLSDVRSTTTRPAND